MENTCGLFFWTHWLYFYELKCNDKSPLTEPVFFRSPNEVIPSVHRVSLMQQCRVGNACNLHYWYIVTSQPEIALAKLSCYFIMCNNFLCCHSWLRHYASAYSQAPWEEKLPMWLFQLELRRSVLEDKPYTTLHFSEKHIYSIKFLALINVNHRWRCI